MALSNVALTNTFDEWRVRTNQIIVITNRLDDGNVRVVSNSSVIQISGGDAKIGNTVFISSNALPTTGGTLTGNLAFSGSNLMIDLL